MAGNLGATVEEGTRVVTSYLVSNAVILPMSGWLANRIGRRNMLLACVTGFTFTSGLCGMATSLDWLIFFRVLQGLTGRGLQPLAQAVLLETFPPRAAWHRHGCLRTRHHPRFYPRPHAGRLDHRQLFPALDLLSQSSGCCDLGADDQRLRA